MKAWVRGALPPHGGFNGAPLPGIFEITLTYNEGVAFGLFQGAGILLAPIALCIAGAAAYHSMRHPQDPPVGHLAMGLLAGGAIGNLYDRIFAGKVTDMFWVRLINFPVFNVADACITVAAVLLVFLWMHEEKKPSHAPLEQESPVKIEEIPSISVDESTEKPQSETFLRSEA